GDEALNGLGLAIGQAEKKGKLTLGVLRGGKKMQVTLKLPVLGAYAPDWPRDCDKSRKVLLGACEYLNRIQNADGSFDSRTWVGYAMNGLAWLASEDPRYLENARRLAYYYAKHNNLDATGGTVVWGWGYMGIFLAEYYMKTGDQAVLPLMEKIGATLARWQQQSGTWGHGPNPSPGYVQGGSLNAAASAAWIALVMFDECDVKVSKAALDKATAFFGRFADRGTVPYGNHRPEFAITGNSKDALASIGFAILGDKPKAEIFARLVTDGYRSRHRGHTGGFLGFTVGNIAGLNNPHRPDYRRMLDHWTWLFDVSRSHDGGFLIPHTIIDSIYTYRGPVLGTGGVALVFAAPSKSLRIFGAPKSVFAGKPPAELVEALKAYHEGRHDYILNMTRGKSVDARLLRLLRIAFAKSEDAVASTERAMEALENGDPALADTILTNLDRIRYTNKPERRITKKWFEERYPRIFEARKTYEKYKWLTSVWPEAKEAFEKLATSPDAGVYARKAKAELARPADSHKWSHYCEILHSRTGGWQRDNRAKYTMIRTATLKGGNWPRLVASRELRAAGVLNDDWLKQWRPLIPACGADGTASKPTWRYFGRSRDAKALADGWAATTFDDSSWKQGAGPLSQERGAPLTVARGSAGQYVRIAFDAKTADVAAARLYYTNPRRRAKAVVYLNVKPVAWLDEASADYRTVELNPAAVKLIRKGRNVLAVRTSGTALDIGLYVKETGQ
ncbi:MAG: hypothetical protein ISS78_11680, partial [Phycisphaerae bacterium]|nr:hypothetical protein [Phycisphaerae bacterium]